MILKPMSNPIHRSASNSLAVLTAILVMLAATAAAQKGGRRDFDGDIEQTMDQPPPKVIEDARRQLESALSGDDVYLRFEALRGVENLDEAWVAEVALPLCASPDLTEQVLALEAVAVSDPEKGRDVFLSLLEHPRRSVRLRSLLGLERIANPDDALDVIRVMDHDPDIDLRVVAARTLGKLGNPEASGALRRKITSRHAVVREQAVMSLLAIDRQAVGPYLIDLLEDEGDLHIVDTMRLLALVPDPTLIGRLEEYLDSDNAEIRTHAAITILAILERSRTGEP